MQTASSDDPLKEYITCPLWLSLKKKRKMSARDFQSSIDVNGKYRNFNQKTLHHLFNIICIDGHESSCLNLTLEREATECRDSVEDKENSNCNNNDNRNTRPLVELSEDEVIGLLDDIPQYKSTFSRSNVTGSKLIQCKSVQVQTFVSAVMIR